MLPQSVKLALWSYDTDKIDVIGDRNKIISQVLNFGNKEATDWIMMKYGKSIVVKEALKITEGQWNKKSLNYWSLILGFDKKLINSRFN